MTSSPTTAAPDAAEPIRVLAFYKFARLNDCAELRAMLAAFCCRNDIKGSIIIAAEGINGTVAGGHMAIAALVDVLTDGPVLAGRLAGAEMKYSTTQTMPFLRMKVRLKREIVTLRAPEANPAERAGTYVEARDWNDILARPGMVILDTRNSYEVKLGSFEGATDPGTADFAAFKEFAATRLDPKRDKTVAMFCTGGIRCEKASSYLLSQGFEEVFHLKGGILKYLEEVPEAESRFKGECFVFDERVALKHGLERGQARLCRACRTPLSAEDRAHRDYIDGVRCAHCATSSAKHEKAAARQLQMELARQRGEVHLGADAKHSAARNRRRKAGHRIPPVRSE